MILSFVGALMLLAGSAETPPAGFGETEPRQDMGFGKSRCSFIRLPAALYPYGGGHATWTSKPGTFTGMKSGLLSFSVLPQRGGPIGGSKGASRFSIEIDMDAPAPARVLLLLDGKRSPASLTISPSYPPGRFRIAVQGSEPGIDSERDRANSSRVVQSLLAARMAEIHVLSETGTRLATASWDVAGVRWLIAALDKSGFSCQPGPNNASR